MNSILPSATWPREACWRAAALAGREDETTPPATAMSALATSTQELLIVPVTCNQSIYLAPLLAMLSIFSDDDQKIITSCVSPGPFRFSVRMTPV